MALYHRATLMPSKAETIAGWAPGQPWYPGGEPDTVGAFRFDDPEGRVGMETHIVRAGDTLVHVPLTYRDAPLDTAADALISEMHHSALGTRWVYDGLGDPTYLIMLAAACLTGQGEAIGMVNNDGRWHIAPTNVRITGGGWGLERVPVDEFEPIGRRDAATCVFRNDRFEMTVYRTPSPGPQPPMGLTARWEGLAAPIVLAEITSLSNEENSRLA